MPRSRITAPQTPSRAPSARRRRVPTLLVLAACLALVGASSGPAQSFVLCIADTHHVSVEPVFGASCCHRVVDGSGPMRQHREHESECGDCVDLELAPPSEFSSARNSSGAPDSMLSLPCASAAVHAIAPSKPDARAFPPRSPASRPASRFLLSIILRL